MSNYHNKNNMGPKAVFEETFDYASLELTAANILKILGTNADFIHRQVFIHNNRNIEASVFYIDGMINSQLVSDYVIKPLMQAEEFCCCNSELETIKVIDEGTVYFAEVKKRTAVNDVLNDVLSGSTAVLFNRQNIAFTFETKGFEKRSVQEPSVENVIKGAKDAFTETIRMNTSTCRRKIKSPNLTIEETVVGKQSKTSIAIVYMKNIVNPDLVDQVKRRLSAIDVDVVLTAGYIEEFIIDEKSSTFPQIQYTERPDRFCTNVADGRVGLLIDGMPIAYIIPGTLLQFLQAPEDYAQNWIVSSALRYLRFTAMFVTLLLPAFFISITSFHQEMIPTELTFSIIASKQGVPFPMFVEVLAMLAAFEVLVEAGLRLPKTIGQTVSIVGALVVGQSAVEAKLISPATVVIIAITAISGFTMPNQDFSNALRIWRFVLAVFACIIGMYGLSMGLLLLLHEWCKIETYGVPYLSPFVGGKKLNYKDTLVRLQVNAMKKRPANLNTINKRRVK